MFKLIKLNNDDFVLIGKDISFEGTLIETIRKMKDLLSQSYVFGSLSSEDINNEIFLGFSNLENHDYADYGVGGRFIFSSNFVY